MPSRLKWLWGVILCGPALYAAGPLHAQEPDTAGSPLVERLTFRGADQLREAELRGAIVTQETRCRSTLLRPFCAITNWRLLERRHYLDPEAVAADPVRLRVRYYQRGFREATVTASVVPRGRGVEVVFEIAEGEPTLIADLRVEQVERVLSGRQVRRAALPGEGERLDLIRIAEGVGRLTDRLGQRGYLDGAVHDTIDVSPDQRRARVDIVLEPGRRSTLADLDIDGNEQVDDRTIRDALRMRRGRVLSTQDLIASQRSLYEANLFHEARVRVPPQADSSKRVEITVREAPHRVARLGGGFNTAEFLQTEARYTHYNFHGRGRRLDLRATVGNLLAEQLEGRGFFRDVPAGEHAGQDAFLKPTWLASAEIMQPAFRSAANTIGLNVFAHRRVVPGIVVDRGFGAEASFTRRIGYRTTISSSYRHERIAVDAGDVYFCVNNGVCVLPMIAALQERHSLSPVALSAIIDEANDPIAATSGYRVRFEAEHASAATLSDFRHNRAVGEASVYYPLDVHRRRILAGRLRAGWVAPLSGTAEALGVPSATLDGGEILHPRKRFYAGGARSVRGYGENQLGPRILTVDPAVLTGEDGPCTVEQLADGSCDPNGADAADFSPRPVGGTRVLEASVEYRFPLRGSFQGAVFVDGATIGQSLGRLFGEGVTAVSPGFGVRMESPVGPIRVDLALRPGRVEDLPVVTEITGEDGERRLVRLDAPFRYDPITSGGFLGKTLGRLRLHLSIGEAF